MNDRNKTGPGADGKKPVRPSGAHIARRMRSADLLSDDGQLIIEHAGREYRLRVTSNGKLILTA